MAQVDYDAIIVGAGISGLVCGCYLAKAGLKTLIIEKNPNPGGYCTSFSSKGFRFDACAHSLGSCRKNGNIAKILKELNLESKIILNKCDPSDIIITPEHRICFWSDFKKTLHQFQESFPHEAKNIKTFFDFIINHNRFSSFKLKSKTFCDILDQYFNDKKLKAILSFPVLGNAGLPASLISAFAALKLYEEFMFDGGYYPSGGMQVLPDALAMRFKEFGGNLILSNIVKKISVKNNRVEGIVLNDGDFISSKFVVSNSDALQTFFSLLGKKVVSEQFLGKLFSMKVSLSMFILYLGFGSAVEELSEEGLNTWYLPHYDIEKLYIAAKNRRADNIAEYMVHTFSKKNLSIFVNAHFATKEYWNNRKDEMANELIRKLEADIPGTSKHITYKQYATPQTLYKTTLNYDGAAYGWAGIPSQFAEPGLAQITAVGNLYLTGHWTTLVQGISGVMYLGRDTADVLLRKIK